MACYRVNFTLLHISLQIQSRYLIVGPRTSQLLFIHDAFLPGVYLP
jgi:hypothetical protein